MAQLHSKNCGLETIEAAVHALQIVVVLLGAAVIGEHPRRGNPLGVVRHERAGVAVGAEVLAGIEAETRDVGKRRDRASFVLRSMRLRGVADDAQAVLLRQRQNRIHVRRLTIEMHRNDGLGLRRDLLFELPDVDVVSDGVAVTKHHPRAGHPDCL